jgi:hypothetical protein
VLVGACGCLWVLAGACGCLWVLCVCLCVFVGACVCVPALWGQFRHDSHHSGLSTLPGPQGPATDILWSVGAMGPIYSSPAIGANGVVYVGSNDHYMRAFSVASAGPLWEFETGGTVRACVHTPSPHMHPHSTASILRPSPS